MPECVTQVVLTCHVTVSRKFRTPMFLLRDVALQISAACTPRPKLQASCRNLSPRFTCAPSSSDASSTQKRGAAANGFGPRMLHMVCSPQRPKTQQHPLFKIFKHLSSDRLLKLSSLSCATLSSKPTTSSCSFMRSWGMVVGLLCLRCNAPHSYTSMPDFRSESRLQDLGPWTPEPKKHGLCRHEKSGRTNGDVRRGLSLWPVLRQAGHNGSCRDWGLGVPNMKMG